MNANEYGKLVKELNDHLDTLDITSENIGSIRRALFLPFDGTWNALVREETAARENMKLPLASPETQDTMYVHMGFVNSRFEALQSECKALRAQVTELRAAVFGKQASAQAGFFTSSNCV